MSVKEKVKEKLKQQRQQLEAAEAEAKEKAKKAEADAQQQSYDLNNNQQEDLNEASAKAQRQLEEQQLDALHALATKAQFENRNEYIYKDGSKIIDHEDGHMSVVNGRWSTPEDTAKLAVESALAKGWDTMSTKGFDDVTQSYMQAIGKGAGLDVRTEAEWQKANEAEAQYEDELEVADDIEIAAQEEQLEPLQSEAQAESEQEQTLRQQKEAEAEEELEIE